MYFPYYELGIFPYNQELRVTCENWSLPVIWSGNSFLYLHIRTYTWDPKLGQGGGLSEALMQAHKTSRCQSKDQNAGPLIPWPQLSLCALVVREWTCKWTTHAWILGRLIMCLRWMRVLIMYFYFLYFLTIIANPTIQGGRLFLTCTKGLQRLLQWAPSGATHHSRFGNAHGSHPPSQIPWLTIMPWELWRSRS